MSNDPLQTYQVVCLESAHTRLYAEVIQMIPERQTFWVRPLWMVTTLDGNPLAPTPVDGSLDLVTLYDLRQTSDLLMPASLFRPALDSEVVTLLAQPFPGEASPEATRTAQSSLNQFVRDIWETHPGAFQVDLDHPITH
ncbi:hypothetical protein BST81_08700 [Leptolyngbya sp. 'hensonii']|uniref:hypothetical protein n=1 Tax=Leptolyngbya sp. 'hensonii' TaxID=1922337 RepID=UPI00094F6A33|nr:hypothetical protein [Leptolyngbya sp. 'hensonii']OLP18808.1 hypothetical protein BST81_08700 [Leptolyngbya sp. 'hensonii']